MRNHWTPINKANTYSVDNSNSNSSNADNNINISSNSGRILPSPVVVFDRSKFSKANSLAPHRHDCDDTIFTNLFSGKCKEVEIIDNEFNTRMNGGLTTTSRAANAVFDWASSTSTSEASDSTATTTTTALPAITFEETTTASGSSGANRRRWPLKFTLTFKRYNQPSIAEILNDDGSATCATTAIATERSPGIAERRASTTETKFGISTRKRVCPRCGETLSDSSKLTRHDATCENPDYRPHTCAVPGCNVSVSRSDNLRQHIRNIHKRFEVYVRDEELEKAKARKAKATWVDVLLNWTAKDWSARMAEANATQQQLEKDDEMDDEMDDKGDETNDEMDNQVDGEKNDEDDKTGDEKNSEKAGEGHDRQEQTEMEVDEDDMTRE